MKLTFIFAGIEDYFIPNQGFSTRHEPSGKNSKFDEELRVRQGKTKGAMPSKSSKGKSKREDSNSSQGQFPQVETWGQAVVQDGG